MRDFFGEKMTNRKTFSRSESFPARLSPFSASAFEPPTAHTRLCICAASVRSPWTVSAAFCRGESVQIVERAEQKVERASRKGLKRVGLEPLIAVVLLMVFTLSIAAIIINWTGTSVKEKREASEIQTTQLNECIGISADIIKVYAGGDKISKIGGI